MASGCCETQWRLGADLLRQASEGSGGVAASFLHCALSTAAAKSVNTVHGVNMVCRSTAWFIITLLASCTCDPTGSQSRTYACQSSDDCIGDYRCIGGECAVPGVCSPGRACYSRSLSELRAGGPCSPGVWDCTRPPGQQCVGEVAPAPETCNGRDDDCDGTADNQLTDDGAACVAAGVGRCRRGTQRCVGGVATCDPGAATAEACDTLDDADCDGFVGCADSDCSGLACDDGNACTFGERCGAGGCDGGTAVVCESDACVDRTCNGTASCSVSPRTGESCDDSNACTFADTCSDGGVCAGTAVTCASNDCNIRICNGTANCTVSPRTGRSCDDGNACTHTDLCSDAGVCTGASITCASDSCNSRACNGTSSCTVTPLTGQPCTDGQACTFGETCSSAGVCGGGVFVSCVDDQCNARVCNGTSSCTVTPRTGVACNDADACTFGDVCNGAGVCAGSPLSCVSDQCNARACNGTSSCTVTPRTGLACNDGNSCTSGETCTAGGQCDGGAVVSCVNDQCNTRTCNGTSSCTVTPRTNQPCDDGIACTHSETCNSSGVCTNGTPVTCTSDSCATRSCNGTASCTVTPIAGCAPCGSGLFCDEGSCVPPPVGCPAACNGGCGDGGTCYINCPGSGCGSAALVCPCDKACIVTCAGSACNGASVRCGSNGCTLLCDGSACWNLAMECGGGPCQVTSYASSALARSTVRCGLASSCNVNCSGLDACSRLVVNGGTGSVALNCADSSACSNAVLIGGSGANTMFCTDSSTCIGARLNGGAGASQLICIGSSSCSSAVLDGGAGPATLTCSGANSCLGQARVICNSDAGCTTVCTTQVIPPPQCTPAQFCTNSGC